MNILAISGSRNPQGQTARAVEALLAGARDGACQPELVLLPPLRIERCRQCGDSGWGTCYEHGQCCVEDDLQPLMKKLAAADAAVFATPVYFSDLAESLKAFLDRLRRICFRERGKNHGLAGKPAVTVCVAGGGGGGAPTCSVNLERTLGTCGFDVVDAVNARRQNLETKLPVLRAVGKWLAGRPHS